MVSAFHTLSSFVRAFEHSSPLCLSVVIKNFFNPAKFPSFHVKPKKPLYLSDLRSLTDEDVGVRPPPPPPPPTAAACARRLLLPFSSKLVRAPLLVLDSARESNTALKKNQVSQIRSTSILPSADFFFCFFCFFFLSLRPFFFLFFFFPSSSSPFAPAAVAAVAVAPAAPEDWSTELRYAFWGLFLRSRSLRIINFNGGGGGGAGWA